MTRDERFGAKHAKASSPLPYLKKSSVVLKRGMEFYNLCNADKIEVGFICHEILYITC